MFDETWLSPDDLINACALDPAGSWPRRVQGLRPHRVQGLQLIPSVLLSCWDRPRGPLALGSTGTVIVLATDGVGWPAAQRCWSPDLLVALTSTFPSTSTAAWLTASTGLAPTVHGVFGPVFRYGTDLLFDCVHDRAAGRADDWAAVDRAAEVSITPRRTVFEELSERGAAVTTLPGDLINVSGRWTDAVLRGGSWVASTGEWPALSQRPVDAVQSVLRDVRAVLSTPAPAAGRLIWAFVHLDPYIHRHGYDATIDRSLALLDDAAHGWSACGHTVIAHADHGLTPTRSNSTVDRMVTDTARDLCRLPAGGAGRTRWWYPQPARHDDVRAAVSAVLGDDALVVPAGELVELGLVAAGGIMTDRVGEIVAIALGERFPLLDPNDRFEHGSLTPDEMLAPFAVWGPRH